MPYTPPAPGNSPTKPRLWRRPATWFAGGFLLVFIGFAVAWPWFYIDGRGAHQVPLWRYYVLTIPQGFRSRALGPTSDQPTQALVVLLEHLLFSAIGGAATMGIAWTVLQRRPAA